MFVGLIAAVYSVATLIPKVKESFQQLYIQVRELQTEIESNGIQIPEILPSVILVVIIPPSLQYSDESCTFLTAKLMSLQHAFCEVEIII